MINTNTNAPFDPTFGILKTAPKLLGESSYKTLKGRSIGVRTWILYLAPHTLGGGPSLCRWSTKACRVACLFSAGRGSMFSVQAGRIRKTQWLNLAPDSFFVALNRQLASIQRIAERAKKAGSSTIHAVRLDGTSECQFDLLRGPNGALRVDMAFYPDVQFYDYGKSSPGHRGHHTIQNFDYTYSDRNTGPKEDHRVARAILRGNRVATCVDGPTFDAINFDAITPLDFELLNGDTTDARFLDPSGLVVLRAKGKALASADSFARNQASFARLLAEIQRLVAPF